ncbi:Ltp family lipoprotein [Cohnella zeiphila]|uniref:Ltp family lipoprotein n=1 Tax=Cohnella zeiphila TaxID=2761120 RepID=A0A7X0VXW1_9BACL|nr:Ltp family lipoprotein [Cohnella zeiphila]
MLQSWFATQAFPGSTLHQKYGEKFTKEEADFAIKNLG